MQEYVKLSAKHKISQQLKFILNYKFILILKCAIKKYNLINPNIRSGDLLL